ncbi:NifB/NifX family molybdenum-iron cluster-binding protein [Coraliomargarita sp. W4R53]
MKTSTTRVAIPVLKDAGLSSTVSAHFGKSRGFIVVDSDGENCHYLDTKSERKEHECAPIRSLVENGCRVLLCQSMGRGAWSRSHEAGLLIHQTKSNSTVTETLSSFRAGNCPDFPDSSLCSHTHHDHDHDHDHS